MLSIGHFSFVGNAGHLSNDPIHGSFTCLVEAPSIDGAIQKLRELVKRLKRTWEGFESVKRVYFDNCVEVKRLPTQGVLANFEERSGEPLPCVSAALPGVSARACVSYGWSSADDDEPPGEMEDEEVDPFVSFRR